MTSRLLVIGLALLLVGCSGESDPPIVDPPVEVQLVDGQVICDSCASVRIVLAGAGTANVTEATLVPSGTARTPVPARIVIAREPRASGDVLVVNAFFDAGISAGEFDLWLDPVNGDDRARVVPRALRVTRARPGVGELAVVRVWVQLSGVDLDGRFTFRTVAGCQSDACAPAPVEAYAATALQVPPGVYTFQLDDVASNCAIAGAPNPATVTLQRGQVNALTYQVSCTPSSTPGWVRIVNRTAGIDLDDAYQVSCSTYTCKPFTLAANRDTVLRVVPGELTIRIGEVATQCTLSSAAAVVLTATAGDTAVASFAIECGAAPGIRATVRMTGRDIDPVFRLTVCDGLGFYSTCSSRSASANEAVLFPGLAPGRYDIYLDDLSENCGLASGTPTSVELNGSRVDVTLDVTCRAFGTVRITAVTTGPNPDLSYTVARLYTCNDYYYYACDTATLPSSGTVDMRAAPGTQYFELRDVAPNCAVIAPLNPATITAIEGGLVELRFEVACQ